MQQVALCALHYTAINNENSSFFIWENSAKRWQLSECQQGQQQLLKIDVLMLIQWSLENKLNNLYNESTLVISLDN